MANLTLASNVDTFLSAANYAAMRSALGLDTGDTPTFKAATIARGTITTDVQITTYTATWNNSGVVFTGKKTNITNTASDAESLVETWQVDSNDKLSILRDGSLLSWNATGTNYERLRLYWSSNVAYIVTEKGASGTHRNLAIGTSGAASAIIRTAGVNRWETNSSGHLLAGTDNSYDIGASGATRPRNLYVGTLIVTPAFRLTDQSVPASTGASGTLGQVQIDDKHIYVCVATNTWKRVAIATW